jgi:S1-C subfamily serine protease
VSQGRDATGGAMSHFTKVATKINNLVALMRALDELGWKYTHGEEGVTVRGWRGQTSKAEISIDMGKYDIGVVKQEDGTYSLEADWWGVETSKGLKEEEVVTQLNAKYAYQRVLQAVEEQGYTIDTNNVSADGTVKLTVSKWG